MSGIREQFPALWQFLGAYLHQDWHDEYATTDEAFRDFLNGEPRCSALMPAELTTVLASPRDEAALERLLLECGSSYLPSRHGIPTATWLSHLLDLCLKK